MEIFSSASSSEKIWTKRRRNPFGLCVGCMASANRLLLLHYAGYGAGGSGKPVCYLYFTGDFYGIYLYENPEYLGPDNYSFLNNNMVVVFQERTLRMYFRISKSTGEIFLLHW